MVTAPSAAASAAVPLVVSSRLRFASESLLSLAPGHCLTVAVNGRRLDLDPGRRFSPQLTAVTEKCPGLLPPKVVGWVGG